ncbi:MAG: hypothetical protein IJ325_04110 [Clostridia bacterium]|nr:hypothetical protein [Clostridia bacterium]
MTDNGDNDTSAAKARSAWVPSLDESKLSDGEIPMETVRSCPSAESPMKNQSVGMR